MNSFCKYDYMEDYSVDPVPEEIREFDEALEDCFSEWDKFGVLLDNLEAVGFWLSKKYAFDFPEVQHLYNKVKESYKTFDSAMCLLDIIKSLSRQLEDQFISTSFL